MRVLLLCCCAILASAMWAGKPFTLVLDPGHGGKDIGCKGALTNEKTIVLDVARRLERMISEAYSPEQVRTVFTRDDDRFISLQERANIANRAGGDFFMSIHVNSVDLKTKGRDKIHGASVYTLGLHKTDNNLAVAMRENAVMELEDDYSARYQGFDPNSSESYIIFELSQNTNLKNSLEMASEIQSHLVDDAGRADKGVRQAGFWVLWATGMPSVLVELDFICNPAAERFMASEQGREACAKALFDSFSNYYAHHTSTEPVKISSPAPVETAQPGPGEGADTYHVQFMTSARVLDSKDKRLSGVPDGASVGYYKDGGIVKYYFGNYPDLNSAQKAANRAAKRFPGSFPIKMSNGKRVLY